MKSSGKKRLNENITLYHNNNQQENITLNKHIQFLNEDFDFILYSSNIPFSKKDYILNATYINQNNVPSNLDVVIFDSQAHHNKPGNLYHDYKNVADKLIAQFDLTDDRQDYVTFHLNQHQIKIYFDLNDLHQSYYDYTGVDDDTGEYIISSNPQSHHLPNHILLINQNNDYQLLELDNSTIVALDEN